MHEVDTLFAVIMVDEYGNEMIAAIPGSRVEFPLVAEAVNRSVEFLAKELARTKKRTIRIVRFSRVEVATTIEP